MYIEDVVEAVFNAMENRNAIGDIRARPLGYYMNILSHLRITKVQTRMIVPFLN